ncbi:MAG: GYF domain-containing protein [Muribaculaceae bacterium]|nr:GYF domain-containing protein [Muribaculaceae bacterium]MDE6855796.1 GYF domain-containing protein [Muribaculaceae bacterium]
MEKEYYIVEGDTRVGPLSIHQLSERGLDPSTLVWTAGMADWTRADRVPELSHLLAERTRIDEQESAFGGYARPEEPLKQPYQQPQQYGAYGNGPQQPAGYSNPQTNWKTLAIVATVCGFLFSCIGGIVGIFAIVQANKAENAARYGDDFTARSAWSTCKTLCIVSFVLIGLGIIGNIFYITKFSSLGLSLI